MGSDRAPKPEIEGALAAARNYGVKVLLVGPEELLRRELTNHPSGSYLPIEGVHASQIIGMKEKAPLAVRSKKGSTLRVWWRPGREKPAHALCDPRQTGRAPA